MAKASPRVTVPPIVLYFDIRRFLHMQVDFIAKGVGPTDYIGEGWAGLMVFPVPDLIEAEAGEAGDRFLGHALFDADFSEHCDELFHRFGH